MGMRFGLTVVGLIAIAMSRSLAAQEEGDGVAGKELAAKLCSGCHIVGSERAGSDVAPPFPAIARDPGVSVTELHGWIGPGHPLLPNLALTTQQTADINAYLDSLRDGSPPLPRAEPGPELPPAPPDKIGEPIGTPK
jgi:mono/diheme cytochrome c family protein